MTKWICDGESLSPEYESRPHEPFLNRSQDSECLECGLPRTAVAASKPASTDSDMNNNKTNNKKKSVLWLIGGAVSASLIFLFLQPALQNVISNIPPGNVEKEAANDKDKSVPNDKGEITPNNEDEAIFDGEKELPSSKEVEVALDGGEQKGEIITPNNQNEVASTSAERICDETNLVKKSGDLYGVIEVGSKGIKAEVIQELQAPNEDGLTFIARDEDIETRDVNPVLEGNQEITVDSVKNAFFEIQNRFSVPCEQIVIYGSSGLEKKAPHSFDLQKNIQQETGRVMEFITPEEESILTFEGVVPEWRRDQVVLLDIGSGNTKGTYLQNPKDNQHAPFAIPYGTVTFTETINENRGSGNFADTADKIKNETLIPEIRTNVQNNPGMQTLTRVYLSGGISWALATLVRPCQTEQNITNDEERVSQFLQLSPEDIETFYNRVTRNQTVLYQPDLSACTEEQKESVEGQINAVKNKFNIDNLVAGSEILRAYSQELYFSEREKVFFSRYAFEALPIGYLINKMQELDYIASVEN